jgi:hypothetical protein
LRFREEKSKSPHDSTFRFAASAGHRRDKHIHIELAGIAMKKELIVELHASFEQLVHQEEDTGVEFWLARDLQKVLGYDRWENFEKVIQKAISACEKSGYAAKDHFLEVTKMIALGKGGERQQVRQ